MYLRAIRPQDKLLLSAALARLSPESSRARFLAPKSHFTSGELRYLTEIDGVDHAAFVAIEQREIIGVARYVRLAADPAAAEAAIVIGDPYQGLGLGRRMGMTLADHARSCGIRRFTATTLSDNVAAHRLFAAISMRLLCEHQTGGIDELVAELVAA
ncbi:MAG: GNAT family N-acetyltransferase [Solirubrobacteraceae bacterium]